MLNTFGVCVVAVVVIIYGFSNSTKYAKRIKILESMVLFVEYAANQIRYLGNSVDNIIDIVENNQTYKDINFIKNIRNKRCDSHKVNLPLSTNDFEHISSFVLELGFADVEGEIARCELYKNIFNNDLENAKNDYKNKGKLYKSMSLLTAAAIFIIFI